MRILARIIAITLIAIGMFYAIISLYMLYAELTHSSVSDTMASDIYKTHLIYLIPEQKQEIKGNIIKWNTIMLLAGIFATSLGFFIIKKTRILKQLK